MYAFTFNVSGLFETFSKGCNEQQGFAASGMGFRALQRAWGSSRQFFLVVTCAAIIDQHPCPTVKSHAVLSPNSSIPLTDSRAPINCQCRCSVSPDAPRVLIESMEKSKASRGESRAPSH